MATLFLNSIIRKSIEKRINSIQLPNKITFTQYLERLFNSECIYIRSYQSTDEEGMLYNCGKDYIFKNGILLKTDINVNGVETINY